MQRRRRRPCKDWISGDSFQTSIDKLISTYFLFLILRGLHARRRRVSSSFFFFPSSLWSALSSAADVAVRSLPLFLCLPLSSSGHMCLLLLVLQYMCQKSYSCFAENIFFFILNTACQRVKSLKLGGKYSRKDFDKRGQITCQSLCKSGTEDASIFHLPKKFVS